VVVATRGHRVVGVAFWARVQQCELGFSVTPSQSTELTESVDGDEESSNVGNRDVQIPFSNVLIEKREFVVLVVAHTCIVEENANNEGVSRPTCVVVLAAARARECAPHDRSRCTISVDDHVLYVLDAARRRTFVRPWLWWVTARRGREVADGARPR